MTKKVLTKISQKKILLITLISAIVLVLAFASLSVTTFALYKSEKKAIIILPGLFGSGLYNSETGEDVWDPFIGLELSFADFNGPNGLNLGGIVPLITKDVVQDELNKLFDNDNAGAPDSVLNAIAMNEDGTPAVESVVAVPWTSESRLKYGVINAQKDMCDSMQAQFGKEYEVQVFNYDFRLDNRASAVLLENYINEKGYEEVILVAHSNGGQVAAIYLARSEENRAKVSKYISYNSPYFGSYSAITILENKNDMIAGVVDMLRGNLFTKDLAENIAQVFEKQMMKLFNMWAVYQLLPSYELLSSDYKGQPAAIISVDEVPLEFKNSQELLDFYCSRPWAKDSQDEIRPALEQWVDYKNSFMVTLDSGEKVLSTTLVDTTYFCGTGNETDYKVNYVRVGDELVYDYAAKTPDGDGIVLVSSGAGLVENETKLHYAEGINHYGVNAQFYDFAADPTNELIAQSIAQKSNWYQKAWRGILYKNKKNKD